MERFPVELLYVLGFVALVLFNYIAQRRARRRQQDEAQPTASPAEEAPELDEDVWGRAPAHPQAPPAAIVALPAPPPAPLRRHPARALLGNKRDLRRAVVLMMILGPCRAQQPPERPGD